MSHRPEFDAEMYAKCEADTQALLAKIPDLEWSKPPKARVYEQSYTDLDDGIERMEPTIEIRIEGQVWFIDFDAWFETRDGFEDIVFDELDTFLAKRHETHGVRQW